MDIVLYAYESEPAVPAPQTPANSETEAPPQAA